MGLFSLLLIPIGLCVISFFASRGKVNLPEAGVSVGAVFVLVLVGYLIAMHVRTSDVETWNGVVAGKAKSNAGCCHPYCCQYCESCTTDSKGSTTCSTYCCQTCYLHPYDVQWDAWSSNDESIYHDGCNSPYTAEPARYSQIVIGEPTAVEHNYTNYIKGNPDSILRREGAMTAFGTKIPPYPKVYDYYRSQRFLAVGVRVPDMVGLNDRLSKLNAKWGKEKKVNVVIVVVSETDEKYVEALREAWIGGKINDIVVVVGVYGDGYTVAFAGVISWTKSEQVKIDLRNRVLDLKVVDGPKLVDIVEEEVSTKYEHRRISDFEYLKASIEPTHFAKVLITILAVLLALGLQIFFWINDPFDRYATRSVRF